jgi:hypothetical protein
MQLIFELKFKHLKKDVLKFLGFHKLAPAEIVVGLTSVYKGITYIITAICQEKNDGKNDAG